MNNVEIHRAKDGIPYEDASAGSICEILEATCDRYVGMLVVKPYVSDQSPILLNIKGTSSVPNYGIKRVLPLRRGDSFTLTVGYRHD